MTDPTHLFRVAALSHRKPTRFRLKADATMRAGLIRDLDLLDLPFLALEGEITPVGRSDFTLSAQLQADLTQACVVTLAPVRLQVDEPVLRRFLADYATPDGDEVEIPEDDSIDPLPEVIDLIDIARESLALVVPPYPRAPGAELGEVVHAAPGTAPLRDDDLRPFAALSRLIAKPGEDGDGKG